mgnify:CR=1 FL=1
MRKIFSRREILERLNKSIEEGKPIIGTGASAGIIAKCAEKGGADLIIVYGTGKSRLMGLPTTRLGDSNTITLGMVDEILNVVKNTPVIGGIEATDPTTMDLDLLVDRFIQAGYSGLINFPTVGMYTSYREKREAVGLGFAREVEMVKIARNKEIFTMAYVFNPEDTKEMVEAGINCICPHVGPTKGGLVGYDKVVYTLNEAVKAIQKMSDVAKSINPDVIVLSHGGPIETPEETKYIYEKLDDVVGYVGASSIERIPVEKAIIDIVSKFKSIPIR